MIKMTKRIQWFALLAMLLVVFAGCKGESPTAPPPGGSPPPGGTPPPAGVTLTLSVSNGTPLVDSTVVITANVSQDGSPVPNGTAVEFSTTNGSFLDTAASTTIRTTTNGVATATLTSSTAGLARITATVTNVSRTIDVTFRPRDPQPPQPATDPTITSIVPSIGRPAGGETIRINGTNLRGPVRVLFDVGLALPVEGFVVSRTDTAIEVITPAVNVGAGQQLVSDIIVFTEVGTANEQRVAVNDGFTFRNEQLTPRVSTATPNSGPVTGGTRVSLIGDGFQAPVQVLFGSAEARVIEVRFTEIIVEAPAGRDTSPGGSETVTGPVDITVVNINSNTRTSLPGGFRYVAAMVITAAGPTEGPFTGGTRVTIDGIGFVGPVAVTIGGVAATPVDVSGTRVIAITSGLRLATCADASGPITVTNISNGDQAVGPVFTYRVPPPVISVIAPTGNESATTPTLNPGETITVTVLNAQPGANRIKVGDATFFVSGTFSADGSSATFSVPVPSNITFPTEACIDAVSGVAGTRRLPVALDVTYTNAETGCTTTISGAITVSPCDPMPCPCATPPPPNAVFTPAATAPSAPSCASPQNVGNVVAAGTAVGTATVTVTNTGGQQLIVSSVAVVSASNATVTITPTTAAIAPQASQTFTITLDPTAVGPFSGRIRINSNDPDTPAADFCFTGNGT